jgi:hypothetical protein
MSSRQERRKLERDMKKGKPPPGAAIPEATVRQNWNSAHADEEELVVATEVKFLRAPRGLPNVRQNTQLKVLKAFMTPASCPHGAGLLCYEVEKGFRAIDVPGKGFAWLKR